MSIYKRWHKELNIEQFKMSQKLIWRFQFLNFLRTEGKR